MNALTPEEFATIRTHPMLRTRDEFRAIVDAVCAEFGIDAAAISAPSRGVAPIEAARKAICLTASQRGFLTINIARMIRRDKSTVRKSIARSLNAMGVK
jgi:hypothetical protein